MFAQGQTRREVIACLAATHDCGDTSRLPMFGPAGEQEVLEAAIAEIFDMSEEDRLDHIVDRLKSLVAQEDFVGLGEIHPAWLVEALSKESPRIIGIILRYLPSRQVRYIIENLPKRLKQKLPQLIDSFAVPSPILKIIKERFERQFISFMAPRDIDEFQFEFVCYLKSADLEKLFRDLGIHELAMALKGVDRRSLNILFNRLSIDEARSLQQRIRSLLDVSPPLLRDAKYTVLEMSLAEMDQEDLLMDIGLNAFARSLVREDLGILPIIKQKLEPRLGHTLRRYIDQHVDSSFSEISEKRKEIILGRVSALAKAGAIESDVARFFIEHGETQEFRVKEDEGIGILNRGEKSDGLKQEESVV